MKLVPSILSLMSLILWESQLFAQSPHTDQATIGPGPKVPKLESEKSDEGEIESDPDPDPVPVPVPEAIVPLRKAEVIHSHGFRQVREAIGQLFDQGSVLSLDQGTTAFDQKTLEWDLGINPEYSRTVKAGIKENRLWRGQRPSFELLGDYRDYKGSGAGLEELYQAANRLNKDFTAFHSPATTRESAAVRLGDEVKIGSQSLLRVNGEMRQDRFEIADALDEGSTYESFAALWRLGLGRDRALETSFHRSLVLYEDKRNHLRQSQDLNEYETQLLQPIAPAFIGGLGFRSLDGERNGPVLSLIRRPDERIEGQLKVSYLKDDKSGDNQTLASFTTRCRITRLLTLNLRLERGVDLLSAFGSQTTGNQSQGREQRSNRIYEMAWTYEHRYSQYTLAFASNLAEYATAQFGQAEARIELDHRFTILDRVMVHTAYRTATEDGQVQRVIDKRYVLVDGQWRHFWGYDTRLFGGRSFGQLGVGMEKLWEGDRNLMRKTLSLAFGQEWL